MSAIAPILPKWKRAIASYKKAIATIEAGDTDIDPAVRARNRLYKVIDEAAGHAGGYQRPEITALYTEIENLTRISTAEERGRAARSNRLDSERKRLDAEIREANRPYDWMHTRGPR